MRIYKVKVKIRRGGMKSNTIDGQYIVPDGVSVTRKQIEDEIVSKVQQEIDKNPILRGSWPEVKMLEPTTAHFCYVAGQT